MPVPFLKVELKFLIDKKDIRKKIVFTKKIIFVFLSIYRQNFKKQYNNIFIEVTAIKYITVLSIINKT